MKKLIFISFIITLFTACKPAATIITSKDVAVKKGMYSEPVYVPKPVVKTEESKPKKVTKAVAFVPKKQTPEPKNLPGINNQNDNDIVIENEDVSYLVEQLINTASDNLGVSYRGGGTTKEGFDCSGLIYSTFKKFDITLPRSSNEMAEIGSKIDLSNAKKGDLIFFINRGQHHINHVGMVVEVTGDDVKFIHSSTQSGVVVSSMNEPYYKRTFAQINRVVE
ncbi:C40 family peptidase [Flavobacterium sp. XGLA_31]|uniref:C40 family peptidase n=1 Tax=Flavobacterium sp. XGLA_31 TaxID=3447666 RepID=UPI003F31D930